jgi:hypothetical protein
MTTRDWRKSLVMTVDCAGRHGRPNASHGRVLAPRLLVVLACIVLMTACSGQGSTQVPTASGTAGPAVFDDALIVYDFHDSSVPPPYHRSLELTVDQSRTRLVIDSYGEVLADESRPTPPEVWSALMDGLASLAALPIDEAQEGCVGGTGERVRVTSGGQVIVDLAVDECAGSNELVSDAIGAWIDPAREVIPSTEELAPP